MICSLLLHEDEVYIQIVCWFCVALYAGCSGWDERIGGEQRRPYLRWLLKVYSLCGAIQIGGMVWAGKLMFDYNWMLYDCCCWASDGQCKMVLNLMLLVWQAEQQGKFVVTYFWLHECLQAGRVITFYFLLSWQFQLIQVVSHDDNPLCQPGFIGGIPEMHGAVLEIFFMFLELCCHRLLAHTFNPLQSSHKYRFSTDFLWPMKLLLE